MRRLLVLLALVVSAPLFAATSDRSRPRHFVVTLAPGADGSGLAVQRALSGGRMLVVTTDEDALRSDPGVIAVEPFDGSKKVFASARRAMASGRAFVTVDVAFHDDVSFEAAQRAITTAGGALETPLAIGFDAPHRLRARVPAFGMQTLADDDAVLAIAAGKLVPRALNAAAAAESHVTPLYSTPYNLDGSGVVLSEFELAAPDTSHREFGGRLVAHPFSGNSTDNRIHATHVAGTITASGIDAEAKGMAPAATLHAFDASRDTPEWLSDKQTALAALGVVADNNSWDYTLGWTVDNSGKPLWIADEFGAYGDPFNSAGYDEVTRATSAPLFVHAAGNDASSQNPSLLLPWAPHLHIDNNGNTLTNETFCYSQNGTGTDCPTGAPWNCSTGKSSATGEPHCETEKHPTRIGYGTLGLLASVKNVVAVGSVDASGNVSSSSSRGPTMDGRVKPEVVARGVGQYSTTINNGYLSISGTSMAAPVVTGITGLLVQQWRKTFGSTPSPTVLKALLIAGADDLGTSGPDYTYGFGLVDAKNSVDLIVADNASGARIRTGTIHNGEDIHIPLTLTSTQNVRVVLGWFDPELFLTADDPLDTKTLLNDLDLRVTGPTGQTTLPYVLSSTQPSLAATRGVNNTDTTEEIEIRNAPAGSYDVVVHGAICPACAASQTFALVANAPLVAAAPPPIEGPRRRSARH